MADFERVLRVAQDGYTNRTDYPPFAIAPWEDRNRWTEYLKKIDRELNGGYSEGFEAGRIQGREEAKSPPTADQDELGPPEEGG